MTKVNKSQDLPFCFQQQNNFQTKKLNPSLSAALSSVSNVYTLVMLALKINHIIQ